MAGGFEGRSSATRGVEQAIVALKKGAHILKCGKRGKPKFCTIRLSYDERALIWYSKEREKRLSLSSVSSVVLGQKTTKLLRLHWPEKESQSLSVIYKNGESSLDLVCKDRDQAECWYIGLTALISVPYTPLLLVNSTNSRQINSCTNSPPSYIQQRSRVFAVHDARNFTKVHSLYGSPRLIQNKFLRSNLDCSEPFFSKRQKAWSELDFYLEKIIPKVDNQVKDNFRDITVAKEQRITQMPKLKPSEGSHAETDPLKDIFVWGDVLGIMSDYGHVSRAKVSLPKLFNSAQILDVQSIACGEKHAAIVNKQGQVFSWGEESGGRLGHKTSDSVSHPKIIESLASTPVKAIAFGAKHTCAVSVSGELYEWGEGIHSLGLWTDQCQRSQWFPHKLIGTLDGTYVSKIACGQWHTAIISSSGQMFTYGDGTFGVLGHGDTCSVARPKEVESLRGLRAKSVACGPWHTAAIVECTHKSNAPCGKLFTWGDGGRWKLGHTDKKWKLVPTCVESLTDCNFVQVSCGMSLTVVLTITGVAFTIGSKEHGQLGNPRSEEKSICMVEGPLKTEFIKEISSGSSHVAVLTMDGKVFTWGKGTEGQLGLGDCVDKSSPTLVEALEDKQVERIVCGSNFTVAICVHRSISSKNQSVCSSCRLAFGFSRKKHNCYNCGSVFCNSCSSNKVPSAALAPDNSKRYRVCDACFSELNKTAEPSKVGSRPKIQKDESSLTETRTHTPKLSRIIKEANFIIMDKMASTQNTNQRNQELATLNKVQTQKWGHVDCPDQFKFAWDSIPYRLTSQKQTVSATLMGSVNETMSRKTASALPQDANDVKEELGLMENIQLEEVKQLRAQVTTLTEQCRHKSLKVQLYKQKVEETWLIVRDEAAKCKAAKDIIKVLTNQRNALSKKLLDGLELDNSSTVPRRIITGQPVKAELPDPPDKTLLTGKFPQLNSSRDQHVIEQVYMQSIPSSNTVVVDDSVAHLNGRRTSNSSRGYDGGTDITVAPTDSNGVIEQIASGVYVTVVTSPGGKKGIKRIRFSRKHFGEKEAQKWWEENEGWVFAKYNSMEYQAT
ncbi:PH, RCC1 and FYVE domains-containing protein 1-like isoform X2 [Phragmites australis]|uniref:PH, RCC1 and FYVE domains-containing protein 1-like isoform X2 n=1 Tax=Phragmites australis TaxID=29695 RepID=UPI002D790ABC|nr:PH, RCC1 and FYVE domains-containing protein 1-like isoform X2 [Phragmites australis]